MSEACREIVRWGRYAARAGLTTAKSGNMSLRGGDGRMVITASGSFLGRLKVEDCVRCPLDAPCAPPFPGPRPSMEAEMHRLLYAGLPGAGAVFHSQPAYSTLFACTREPLPLNLVPEAMAYIPRVVRIPYHHPGSLALAEAAAQALGLGELGLLESHGVLVAAPSLEEAVLRTETLEFLCRLLYLARAASLDLVVLPEAVKADLLDHLARVRGYGRR